MSNELQEITSPDLRKWFTMTPNLYDDADLDVYEFRLLSHYVKVGNCWESTKTTAKNCKMSVSTVISKRLSLESKGFIMLTVDEEHGNTWLIEVVDKWQENFNKYSEGHTISGTGGLPDVIGGGLPDVIDKEEPIEEEPIEEKLIKKAAVNRPSIKRALFEAGIVGEKIQQQLSQLEHITPEYIKAHSEYAKRKKMKKGLLIHKMLSGDPMPEYGGHQRSCVCEECRKKYVTGEFSEFISH